MDASKYHHVPPEKAVENGTNSDGNVLCTMEVEVLAIIIIIFLHEDRCIMMHTYYLVYHAYVQMCISIDTCSDHIAVLSAIDSG